MVGSGPYSLSGMISLCRMSGDRRMVGCVPEGKVCMLLEKLLSDDREKADRCDRTRHARWYRQMNLPMPVLVCRGKGGGALMGSIEWRMLGTLYNWAWNMCPDWLRVGNKGQLIIREGKIAKLDGPSA